MRAATRAFREAASHPAPDSRTSLDRLRPVLGAAPVAIDIGANIGHWTRGFLEVFPAAWVLMIEAQPELAGALDAVAGRHPNVQTSTAVLADRAGVREFYVCQGDRHRTGSSLRPELTGAELSGRDVMTTTVDALLADRPPPRPVDLLKLDTQGSELDILLGAPNTLGSVRLLQLEVSLVEYNAGAPLLAEVVAFLADRGFHARDVFDLKYLPASDDLLQFDCIFGRDRRSLTSLASRS